MGTDGDEMGTDGDVELLEALLAQLPSLTIPLAQCSYPWANHPDAKRHKAAYDSWIIARFGGLAGISTSFHADALISSGFDLLTTSTFVNATPSRLPSMIKYMAWIFLFDNFVDDPQLMGADPRAADALFTTVSSVLDDPAFLYVGEDPIIRVVAESTGDWWHEMRAVMPVGQQARFVTANKHYLEASRKQIHYRNSCGLPDVETFLVNRMDVGGWDPCAVLIEYGLAIELDEEVLKHPLFCSLHSAVANHIYRVNELYSFKNELLQNDLLSLVPVLYAQKLRQQQEKKEEVTLEGVVHEVCAMIKECDETYVRLVSEIKGLPLLIGKPGVASYLQGLGHWMAGNYHWHFVTWRYGICSIPPPS